MDGKNNYPFAKALCRNSNFKLEMQRHNTLKTNCINKKTLCKSPLQNLIFENPFAKGKQKWNSSASSIATLYSPSSAPISGRNGRKACAI